MENTYLPRVWTEEGYYYPVFSEFGIIYENKNLPFDEEHIKDLDWAFQFHFTGDNIDFVHILERPTGLKDKNGNLIFEGDIIGNKKYVHEIIWSNKDASFHTKLKGMEFICGHLEQSWIDEFGFEIIGNIHEKLEILEPRNDN